MPMSMKDALFFEVRAIWYYEDGGVEKADSDARADAFAVSAGVDDGHGGVAKEWMLDVPTRQEATLVMNALTDVSRCLQEEKTNDPD